MWLFASPPEGKSDAQRENPCPLADETGGLAAVNYRNGAPIFDRIVRTTSTYYLLGYYQPDHPRDGRFHSIEVRVKRPDLRVSARKGYGSPKGKTQEELRRETFARQTRQGAAGTPQASGELREVLNSPMQQSGLTLAVQPDKIVAAMFPG